MTCILALKYDGAVYMGSDSLLSTKGSDYRIIQKQPKVFSRGDFLIGTSGNGRMSQLIQYALKEEFFQLGGRDPVEHLILYAVPEIRKLLDENGLVERKKDHESIPGNMLMGVKDRILVLHTDFDLIEYDKCSAIGSGYLYAESAIHALTHFCDYQNMANPTEFIKIALQTAAAFCSSVAEPFHYFTTKDLHGQVDSEGFTVEDLAEATGAMSISSG